MAGRHETKQFVNNTMFQPKTSQEEKKVHDILEQILKGFQQDLLLKMVAWSLQSLRNEFLPPGSDHDIISLEQYMSSASLNERITIFFFLLNLHMQLKDFIMEMDPHNSRKLVRFMTDLRKYAILGFCSNETQSIEEFVAIVYEYYMLA